MINVEVIKQQILDYIKEKGPSLPIHIAKKVELSPMFTSAILSELTNIKQVKTSSLKVGSSPLYYLPGQEQQLENFSDNLGGVEKEAFIKLQQNKIVDDKKQTPAIRVALRNIKDFAVAFRFQDNLFWRYVFLPKEEFQRLISRLPQIEIRKAMLPKQAEPIVEKPQQTTQIYPQKIIKPKPIKIKKANQNFLEEIKTFLKIKQIEIISLEHSDKRKITVIVRLHSQPHLLTAFNKKRITESDIIKAYKKSAELNIPYYLIARAEPTKKMQELSQAYKKLSKIDALK